MTAKDIKNAANTLLKLKKGEDPISKLITPIRITNRLNYIDVSPYMTRREKNFARNQVRNKIWTLNDIKKFERGMKKYKNDAVRSFLKSAFTPRKNVKK
tara:strand:+ start:598 stop:894 length:297 start_codon:yes stop_codon:yes gene_type:complete